MDNFAGSIKRPKSNDERYDKSDSEMYGTSFVDDKKRAAMESHCEIERRRRNKMAALVNELADIIPACNSFDKKKPDKLTVLKLASEHLQALKDTYDLAVGSCEGRSSFVTDSELKKLVLGATSGFLFVVICATGQVIYVSDTVTNVLGLQQIEWDNANLYDMIDPEDRNILRQQLQREDHEPPPQSHPTVGAPDSDTNSTSDLCRRSFIVKMKTLMTQRDSKDVIVTTSDGTHYAVIHITGYIRQWPSSQQSETENQSCLVAIGHYKQRTACDESEGSSLSSPQSFLARHRKTGMFTFVDSRITNLLGYKPVDLLQKSILDFCHEGDRCLVEESFNQVMEKKDQVVNINFRFMDCSKTFVPLRMSCSTFLNPFSEVVEYISATYTIISNTKHLVVPKSVPLMSPNLHQSNLNSFSSVAKPSKDFTLFTQSQMENQPHFAPSVVQSHNFNVVSARHQPMNTLDNLTWVDSEHKKVSRHLNMAPPDYHHHHHLNDLYSANAAPGTISFQQNQSSGYQWTPVTHNVVDQNSGIDMNNHISNFPCSSNITDINRHNITSNVNNQNMDNILWPSFDTSCADEYSSVNLWQAADLIMNNNQSGVDDMNEVMDMLGTTPTSSAFFSSVDENIMKRF